MKVKIIAIGKTKAAYLKTGIDTYLKRLPHYSAVEYIEWAGSKKKEKPEALKKTEGQWILSQIDNGDHLILLDERGKQYSSTQFAKRINEWQIRSLSRVVFVIGGAYGFSQEVYQRANEKIALSAMTFSHQMIRIFILEQLYRAFTILKGESYHNE